MHCNALQAKCFRERRTKRKAKSQLCVSEVVAILKLLAHNALLHAPSDLLTDTAIPFELGILLTIMKNPIMQRIATHKYMTSGMDAAIKSYGSLTELARQIDDGYAAGFPHLYESSYEGHWKIISDGQLNSKTNTSVIIEALIQRFEDEDKEPPVDKGDSNKYMTWVLQIKDVFASVDGFAKGYMAKQLARVNCIRFAPDNADVVISDPLLHQMEPDRKGWLKELQREYPGKTLQYIANTISHSKAPGSHVRGWDLAWAMCEVGMAAHPLESYSVPALKFLRCKVETYKRKYELYPPIVEYGFWLDEFLSE